MLRTLLTVLTVVLVMGLGSCGGGTSAPDFGTARFDTTPIADPPGSVVAQHGTFSLEVLDGSFTYGGSAEFSLDVSPNAGGGSEVTVAADASDLRSALLELHYDAATVHPVESNAADWPETTADDMLRLTILDRPGTVYHGTVLTRPQERAGVSGQFAVLTVDFADGAAEQRTVSAVPDQELSAIPDFTADFSTGDVQFSYVNVGDYNQNSIVEVADLTPLGVHFGEQSPDLPDPFPFDSIGSVVDGNQNGLVEVADLTPIGQGFGKAVDHYVLYGGDIADFPTSANDDNGGASALATIDFPAETTQAARLSISQNVPELTSFTGEAVWLRPVGNADDEGIGSNRVDLVITGDVTPPSWTFDPEGVGVVQVIPLDGGARVMWGEATDDETPPVEYVVYYNEGSTVDFDTASTLEVAVSDPYDANTDQIREITGLDNDTEYAFAVRARDSADPANEDANANMMTVTPLATAEVPDTLTGETFFEGPMVISAGNTVSVTGGECIHFQGDLTIEVGATLQGLTDTLCIIVEGNLICNGSIVYSGPTEFPSEQDANSLELVLKGGADFGETSIVTGNGNIYIVDDEDSLISPEDVENETANDTTPEDFPFNMMPEEGGGGGAGGGKGASTTIKTTSRTNYYGPIPWQRWFIRGNWGKIPAQARNVRRVILRAHQSNGQMHFVNFSIEGPPGQDGADASGGCDVTGGDGEDNRFSLRVHSSRQMTFNNVNIKLGDGGNGGKAETDLDCCPQGTATGGNGGSPNNKFRFTSGPGGSIQATGAFNLNPGNGGRGGDADAWGGTGKDGCPPDDGCDAVSVGGNGGDVPRWGARVRGNVTGLGNINMGSAMGGDGGDAFSLAGDGGNDTCPCPGGVGGGDGGYAQAIGGDGGDSVFNGMAAGMTGGGCQSGDGGSAEAYGGIGGLGLSCFKRPGSDGGAGGDAVAGSGEPGTATGTGAVQGTQSSAEAYGGDGGDGGDGCAPGSGGTGGLAAADGTPQTQQDGEDGADGVENPPGCVWIWCIPLAPPFLPSTPLPGPQPIPSGYNGGGEPAPLLDMQTLEQIGTVPFEWYNNDEFNDRLFYYINEHEQPAVYVDNLGSTESAGVTFDFSQIEFTSPEYADQYAGLSGTELYVDLCSRGQPTGAPPVQIISLEDPPILQSDPIPDFSGPDPLDHDWNFTESFFDVLYDIQVVPDSYLGFSAIWFIDP